MSAWFDSLSWRGRANKWLFTNYGHGRRFLEKGENNSSNWNFTKNSTREVFWEQMPRLHLVQLDLGISTMDCNIFWVILKVACHGQDWISAWVPIQDCRAGALEILPWHSNKSPVLGRLNDNNHYSSRTDSFYSLWTYQTSSSWWGFGFSGFVQLEIDVLRATCFSLQICEGLCQVAGREGKQEGVLPP